jgi:hypothetical protein
LSDCTEGTVWEEKKAKHLSVIVPDGRIVSRVQVELTAVKMCIYETETPSLSFEFAETGSNDPNPLISTIFLPDTCGCNICPESQEGSDLIADDKQWRDTKQFTLDIHFPDGNSTLCIKLLTVKLFFASESSFIHFVC